MTEREASREKFEEFWISRYKDEKVGRRALNDDDYGYVSRDWLFWQASRQQALEELEQAQMVLGEAYQVVGSMLSDLGQFETDRAEHILDNLSQMRMVHDDVLPWPSFEVHSLTTTGDK